MIITTTPTVEGHRITGYLGIVAGETIVGINVIKDFAAGIRNIVGGRSSSYERETFQARESAIAELVARAQAMGADAIVGVDIDYESLGSDNGMMMVSATGTAVRLGPAAG
ncbi:YbjQ family protein [Corynebacterium hylobatis]|uniref:UPF0145 protein EAH68_05980 n=1 Tax=Corynebacterium hylobatis TaxID=1859290 RepID=A0A430HYL8_9CORY|nr:heavy metal-binding domain-containing protein [Corynebacterium hylobatis]RSZ63786.1 YbjQ family protein [Corynebacterium hylobatis]